MAAWRPPAWRRRAVGGSRMGPVAARRHGGRDRRIVAPPLHGETFPVRFRGKIADSQIQPRNPTVVVKMAKTGCV